MVDKLLQTSCNNVQINLYGNSSRVLKYGYINNSNINAFACASPDKEEDFIGIYLGAIFALHNIFFRILAHPLNFPDIGNPEIEDDGMEKLPFLSQSMLTLKSGLCIPKCKVRAQYAQILFKHALMFLFFHEVTHLRNGHIELLTQEGTINSLVEINQNNKTANHADPLIRQTLEWDADSGGTQLTFESAFSFKRKLDQMSQIEKEKQPAAVILAHYNDKAVLRAVIFSIYMKFRLFDAGGWDHNTHQDLTHPHHAARMWWVPLTLDKLLKRPNYNVNMETFQQDALATIIEAETACMHITGAQELDVRGILSVLNDQQGEYIQILDDCWKKIRPTLDKHKRGNHNLAP